MAGLIAKKGPKRQRLSPAAETGNSAAKPGSPSKSSPAKRSNNAALVSTSGCQTSIRAFFGESNSKSRAEASPTRTLKKGTLSKSQEELDLERALAESVKDHEQWLRCFGDSARDNLVHKGGGTTTDTHSAAVIETPSSPLPQAIEAPTSVPELAVIEEVPSSPLPVAISGPSASPVVSNAKHSDAKSRPARVLHPISALAALNTPQRLPTLADPDGPKALQSKPEEKPATGKNAFSVLMRSHTEQKEWAKADEVEAANYRGKARSRPEARTAPFYKVLQGMPLSVDAFRFGKIDGCTGYFLTHFHSDHYGGITANWSHGPIYCSKTTANLVRTCLRVEERWLRPLPMEEPTLIPNSGGVRVTCIEANHCPGSCLFLFEGPQTAQILPSNHRPSPHIGTKRQFRYLHCGDFRASPLHANHSLIKNKKLDIIYLDTTYLNPRYCFPAQEQVVEACAELVRSKMPDSHRTQSSDPKSSLETSASSMRQWLLGGKPATEQEGLASSKTHGNSSSETAAISTAETTASDLDDLQFADGETGDMEWSEVQEGDSRADLLSTDIDNTFDDDVSDFPDDRAERELDADDEAKSPRNIPESEPPGDSTSPKADSSNAVMQFFQKAAQTAQDKRRSGRLLVIVGTYTIGKEKIVKAVAHTLGSKVFCADSRKYRVYAQLEDPELHSLLTRDPGASVHVTNLHAINGENMRDTMAALRARGHNFTHAIAFRPTGWTYKPPAGMDVTAPSLERLIAWNQSRNFSASGLSPTRDSTPDCMIYGVPYSEHSSFVSLSDDSLSDDSLSSARFV